MVTGKKKKEITKDWVLSKVGELDIYSFYIPSLKLDRKMMSPFRKESTASFAVWETKGGHYAHKDYGAPENRGGPFDFVSQLYGLTFRKALEKVAEDMLGEGGVVLEKRGTGSLPKKKKIPDVIQVEACKLSPAHLEYLQSYHLSPRSLNIFPEVKVVGVKKWALNRLLQPLGTKEVAFAYVHEKGVKIYRPFAKKEEKWKSTLPFRIVTGLSNLKGTEWGIITKGTKDAWVIGEHITKAVCCVQGEDLSAITEEDIAWVNANCKHVYLNFDNDAPGKKASLAITGMTGWKHINVPDQYLEEGITDFADFIKKYGPEALKAYFKSKIKEYESKKKTSDN